MGASTPEVLFARKLGIVRKTVLHGAAQRQLWLNESVGLGHNTPVDASRSMARRSAMVLCRAGYKFYFIVSEEAAQLLVFADKACGNRVMMFATFLQTDVMTSSSHVEKTRIYLGVETRHFKTAADNGKCMVAAVSCIKSIVKRQDIPLYIRPEFVLFSMQCGPPFPTICEKPSVLRHS